MKVCNTVQEMEGYESSQRVEQDIATPPPIAYFTINSYDTERSGFPARTCVQA